MKSIVCKIISAYDVFLFTPVVCSYLVYSPYILIQEKESCKSVEKSRKFRNSLEKSRIPVYTIK